MLPRSWSYLKDTIFPWGDLVGDSREYYRYPSVYFVSTYEGSFILTSARGDKAGFLTILLLTVSVFFNARAEATVRILPLGNSITQANSFHRSYRYELWKFLIDSDIPFDYVGSERNNQNGNPVWPDYAEHSFGRDHEGYWVWRVDEINAQMPDWLYGSHTSQGLYTPDIVLYHLGSNDAFQSQSTSSTVAEITFCAMQSCIVKRPRAYPPWPACSPGR